MNVVDSSCPFCRNVAVPYLSGKDINRNVSDEVFHLYKCQSCSLLFVANPPADLGPFYVQGYHGIPQSDTQLEAALSSQAPKFEILSQFKKGGDLLEIGSSVGLFSALAQRKGFNVSTIEYDANCVDFMKSKFGINAVQSEDPDAVLAKEARRFDAICLWHSIEHLKSPWTTLTLAAEHLKPEGVLLVAAPNPESRQAKLMGKYWPHHDLPRHLYGLSMPWMQKLAEQNGLATILSTTRDKESIYWNRFSWAMNFNAIVKKAPKLVQRVFWRLGLIFGKIAGVWEDKEGTGSCYVMVFKK